MSKYTGRLYDAAPQMLNALKDVARELEGTCVTVNDTRPLNRNPSSMMARVLAAIEAAERKDNE